MTDDGTLREIIDRVDDMEHHETKKLSFFTGQLSLILRKDPRRRRFSCDLLTMACDLLTMACDLLTMACDLLTMACDLLTMACMWQNVSPALYKQIKSESILTLPTAKYVRRLSSGLNVEAGYEVSDVTRAYLQAKKRKLSEKDAIVAILMDEI